MSVAARFGRPMLAGIFIVQGFDQLRSPHGRAKKVDEVITPDVDETLESSPLPTDRADLVRLNGAVHLGAGVALATNRAPRLAALALAGSLVPTTYVGHRFWEETDPDQRAAQRLHFLKNAAMLGGLLVTAGDTGSRPSVGWRVRRAAADIADRSPDASEKLGAAASSAASTAQSAASTASSSIRAAADTASGAAADAASVLASTAADVGAAASDAATAVASTAPDAARAARRSIGEALAVAAGALSSAAAVVRTIAKDEVAPRLADARDVAAPVIRDVVDRVPTSSAS